MQLRRRFLLFVVLVAFACPGSAWGQVLSERPERPDIFPTPLPVCEAPISTCSFGSDPAGPLASSMPVPRDDCPLGYACTCVPSRPGFDDCDARVCVRDSRRECDSACDCSPGLDCAEGRCVLGFVAVFCCDSDVCPIGAQCQHRSGERATCEAAEDPLCRARIALVTRVVDNVVRHNASCRHDSDCVFLDTTTECRGTCGAFVSRKRAERSEYKIDRVDRKLCGDFLEDGCVSESVPCPAVLLRPACVDRRCTGVPGGILPPPPLLPVDRVRSKGAVVERVEIEALP